MFSASEHSAWESGHSSYMTGYSRSVSRSFIVMVLWPLFILTMIKSRSQSCKNKRVCVSILGYHITRDLLQSYFTFVRIWHFITTASDELQHCHQFIPKDQLVWDYSLFFKVINISERHKSNLYSKCVCEKHLTACIDHPSVSMPPDLGRSSGGHRVSVSKLCPLVE